MAAYDLRFINSHHTEPVLTFPGHHNEAHTHFGFDVSADLGIAASAQQDGTVKLFSLRSGEALSCPGLEGAKMEMPVQALMFKTTPGEKSPSLFVGEGGSVRKYSWGALSLDDEA